jgi:two-component sensor histidine kinase
VGLFIISFGLTGYFANHQLKVDYQKLLSEKEFSAANSIATAIGNDLSERSLALLRVAIQIESRRQGPQSFFEHRPVLAGLFNGGLFIINNQGEVTAAIPHSIKHLGVNYSETENIFSKFKNKNSIISTPVVDKILHSSVIFMSAAIHNSKEEVIGALVGVIDLEKDNFITRNINTYKTNESEVLIVYPQKNISFSVVNEMVVLRPLPNSYQYIENGFIIDKNDLITAKHIPDTDIVAITRIPQKKAFFHLHKLQNWLVGQSIIASLLVAVIVWFILKWQIDPLTNVSKSLSHFSLTDKKLLLVPKVNNDEIGFFLASFNQVLKLLYQQENELKSSLKEKEVMLLEIHHRVKNNLQVVYSLLDLQSKKISDKKTREIFEESRNRIMSMSLIHENLYHSENLDSIVFKKYLGQLMTGIAETYNRPEIDLIVDMDELNLDIHVGIPCGLIANELVSNCFKYAFPNGQKGEIRLGIEKNSDNFNQLKVIDNGIGMPADFDFKNSSSLGLLIVNVLVAQINGKIEMISGDQGTEFSITFPDTLKKQENFSVKN